MKIKSRAQKLAEYDEHYPERIDDAVERVKRYLSQQKNPEKWVKKAKEKALRIMEEREFRSIHILAYEYPMKTDRPRTAGGHTFSPNAAANKNYFDKLNPVDKPDYDNIGKCYTDIFTGILTADDDIFWHGEIYKWYSLLPRVDITIRYLTKHESDYIYKKLKNRKSIKAGIESGQIVLEKLGG